MNKVQLKDCFIAHLNFDNFAESTNLVLVGKVSSTDGVNPTYISMELTYLNVAKCVAKDRSNEYEIVSYDKTWQKEFKKRFKKEPVELIPIIDKNTSVKAVELKSTDLPNDSESEEY